MNVPVSMVLPKEAVHGYSCLKCRAITRCSQKVLLSGDDSVTYLTLGQRDTVYCPVCQAMQTAEFMQVLPSQFTRLVDAMGQQLYPSGLPVNNPMGSNLAFAPAPGAAAAMPTGAGTSMQVPAGGPGVGMMMPSPLQGTTVGSPMSASGGSASSPAPALMPAADFDKHISGLTDEGIRSLRTDLQKKLESIEKALQERRKCIICCDRDKAVVLLPCKHMNMCSECSEKVTVCPECKKEVADRIVPFS